MEGLAAVILAAGKGTRMRSKIPKVLHPVAGRPMISYPIDLTRRLGAKPIVVVLGHGAEAVREHLSGDDIKVVLQEPQLGTGHATMVATRALDEYRGDLLILSGDMPLLELETIKGLVERHQSSKAALTVLVGKMDEPSGYGRIIRDASGRVIRIVEEKDASEAEKTIKEVNAGAYCVKIELLREALDSLRCENSQGEYYLTDIVEALSQMGVESYPAGSMEELVGVNDRVDLANVEGIIQGRIKSHWMRMGVTFLDPKSVFLDTDVVIGEDAFIGPNVRIQGKTIIGSGCKIGMGSYIRESVLEEGVEVLPYCVITQSKILSQAKVGPFAHLRPGTVVGEGAKVGNFVEMKNSTLGKRSKAPHLSYLGDAQIGEDVNIGAGTITCNYDGRQKHKTIVEDRVFVGSDTQLVAPVRVMEGAVIGAGSTITRDVPPGALAIARGKQVNLLGRAEKLLKRGS